LRWEFQRRLIVAIIAIIVISVILLSCSTKTAALSWRERIERERGKTTLFGRKDVKPKSFSAFHGVEFS
jgi:hypothetical protein